MWSTIVFSYEFCLFLGPSLTVLQNDKVALLYTSPQWHPRLKPSHYIRHNRPFFSFRDTRHGRKRRWRGRRPDGLLSGSVHGDQSPRVGRQWRQWRQWVRGLPEPHQAQASRGRVAAGGTFQSQCVRPPDAALLPDVQVPLTRGRRLVGPDRSQPDDRLPGNSSGRRARPNVLPAHANGVNNDGMRSSSDHVSLKSRRGRGRRLYLPTRL